MSSALSNNVPVEMFLQLKYFVRQTTNPFSIGSIVFKNIHSTFFAEKRLFIMGNSELTYLEVVQINKMSQVQLSV